MSDTTRWVMVPELRVVTAQLASAVAAASDNGHWLDFSACENLRISVDGTISAGTYDILACDSIQRPADSDNLHPSLLQGLSGSALNWLMFPAPPHWVKFITGGTFTGLISCGATADVKDAWKR